MVATSDTVPPCPQVVPLEIPNTPTTPKTTAAFALLQSQIMQQDIGALDEASKLRLEKRIQKCVNAVQTCHTKGALQQDYIRVLLKINDESKIRRSTKSNILAKGEGMVISYEHLVAKREALAAKAEAKAAGTGKRGRKRTRPVEVEEDVEPSAKMARTSEARLELRL
ncbi:hypothetical protein IQ07DRAFT_606556 [Pyrenochaeta sp. DS3sAY3a]|nr:hypothetical protein IQ07DRAFT_606556 [Pyrenochaeta sp. DS3sAY3a]